AEQECVNEELQAANEELLTANEELQSSNEELQSVNEELYTVNSEYQAKLTELNDLNDDIANFLESTMTGIVFVDNKLHIRRFTDYMTSEFSVMDHDIGRSIAFISYHFPSISLSDICTTVLKTLIPDEREIVTNRGKVFFMRVAPYRSTENKIMGCVINLMDVTSQKQEQSTLQSTEKQLSIAKQASDAKSDYLSRILGEIRASIDGLHGLTETAKALSDDKIALFAELDKIADAMHYLSVIATDVSQASLNDRMAAGETIEAFALRSVLSAVSAAMDSLVREGDVSLSIALDDGFAPMYVGNRSKLQQILTVFLDNAVKYTPPGGSITVQAYEEPSVNDKARVCFVITDTGIGVKEEDLPRLFKPYAKPDSDDAGAPISLGLGLSIAYGSIASMGGDVTVESKENEGSTFTIRLLLDRCAKSGGEALEGDAEIAALLQPQYDLAGYHVLIVEDNSLSRTVLGTILSDEGVTFTEAKNGEEALRAFMESPERTFACILMDIRMPKIDGIEATERIRACGKADAKTVPIIGVSAYGHEEDIKAASVAGMDSFIKKPIDPYSLFMAMSKLIRQPAK
ncbi:MAG: response regulator, partial [Eubacteriales bacterium]|nr:response regulator [Eubacteriales bacterium]